MNTELIVIIVLLIVLAAAAIVTAVKAKHDGLTFKAEGQKELAAVEQRAKDAVHAVELKVNTLEGKVANQAAAGGSAATVTTAATPPAGSS